MQGFDTIGGIVFPHEARKVDARCAIQRLHDSIGGGGLCVACNVPGGVYCEGIGCRECIFCLNCGSDVAAKKKAFEEYKLRYPLAKGCANSAPADDMPELRCGTVLKLEGGSYWLIEGPLDVPVREVNGRVCLTLLEKTKKGEVVVRCRSIFPGGDGAALRRSIVVIYGDRSRISGELRYLSESDLSRILSDGNSFSLWKKPDPVKEMTVDEISKALGYKVKVVGSEKADD